MPASVWKASIVLSFVSIPVKLYAVARSERIYLHQLHTVYHTRLRQPLFCPTCERFVKHDEVIKGYEVDEDQIFEREADNTTVCIQVVKGFHEARSRIEQAPAASPDSELFIVDPLPGKTIDPSASAIRPTGPIAGKRSWYSLEFATPSSRFAACF